jgi:hypothetical protein
VNSDPVGELILRESSIGELQHLGDDFRRRSLEVQPVNIEEGDQCEEANTVVSVPVRMVPDEPERVRRRERLEVNVPRIVPTLLRPGQGGFESVFIPDARQSSVLTQLVGMDGVDNETAQPTRFLAARWHASLRQFPQRIPVLLGSFGGSP